MCDDDTIILTDEEKQKILNGDQESKPTEKSTDEAEDD